jgi:ABC-2 type transport system permease protein
MSFSGVYGILLRQIFLIRNNPSRLATIFLWLLVDLIQWGFISKYLGSFGQATFGFVSVILGAIILWGFVTRIQQGIMTAFLEDVWTQNFINFLASPLSIVDYLSGLVLTSIGTGLIGFAVAVLVAGAFFDYNIFRTGLLLVPAILILFAFATAMGTAVSAMIFRFGPSAEWLGWPVPLVMSVFSGVYYPIATLPPGLQLIAHLVPASYVFETIRAVLGGDASAASLIPNLLCGAGLVLLYLIAAYALFVRVYKRNLRTGAIARFTAESY